MLIFCPVRQRLKPVKLSCRATLFLDSQSVCESLFKLPLLTEVQLQCILRSFHLQNTKKQLQLMIRGGHVSVNSWLRFQCSNFLILFPHLLLLFYFSAPAVLYSQFLNMLRCLWAQLQTHPPSKGKSCLCVWLQLQLYCIIINNVVTHSWENVITRVWTLKCLKHGLRSLIH